MQNSFKKLHLDGRTQSPDSSIFYSELFSNAYKCYVMDHQTFLVMEGGYSMLNPISNAVFRRLNLPQRLMVMMKVTLAVLKTPKLPTWRLRSDAVMISSDSRFVKILVDPDSVVEDLPDLSQRPIPHSSQSNKAKHSKESNIDMEASGVFAAHLDKEMIESLGFLLYEIVFLSSLVDHPKMVKNPSGRPKPEILETLIKLSYKE